MTDEKTSPWLAGQLLIAMPQMQDPRFSKSVIYMCAHSEEGAMGLVINKLIGSLTFADLVEQLDLEMDGSMPETPIHFGGPVETSRGFVLHSLDYLNPESMVVEDSYALTATVDILRDMAQGSGPKQAILALGYAGWGPGQLDREIQANGWLSSQAHEGLVFGPSLETIWDEALAGIGVSAHLLSSDAGHA